MSNQITEIQILPVKPQDGLIGFVSFVLNRSIYLSSIAIVTRPQGGYRLVYPTKKVTGRDISLFYPINKSFSQFIEEKVIEQLEEVMKKDHATNIL